MGRSGLRGQADGENRKHFEGLKSGLEKGFWKMGGELLFSHLSRSHQFS